MKKIIVIVVLVLLGLIIYLLKPFGFKQPTNYTECVEAGGKTNKNETRVQDACQYNGKTFLGNNF